MCSGKVIEWDEAGNPLRMIGCHVDISDRKRAETALRESERRYAALAKSAPVGIFRNDVNGSLIYANERWSEITGLTLAEGLGDRWLTCVHPNWRDRLVSEWAAIIEEGSHHYVESCLQMPDGSLKWVYCQAQPEKDASGQVVGYVGSLTDVTTLVQTRQLLAEQTTQLKATVQELESFSYSVSHDLRAPLRHIHGFANALRQQLEPHSVIANPKVAHYLKVIDESSLKLGRLIDGLLTLSRVGRRQLTYELVNTRQLVQQAIDLLSSDRPAAAKAEFVLGDLPIVRGDAVLLQQVFSNLINNALKFSRSVPAPRIIVDSLADDTLFVRDNGVGFEMAYADQLFGPFQRLHSQREFEGTGIGLAIVQRIIHRHGGTIWAESQSGQGATFYFTLQRPIPPH
ncbi:MAG: PAS domain S-box protein [Leptolyngbya sp. SIO4C5]|nr:PAS domain S-box protein [Leptolyngbya sp. SIO4C5]